MSGPDIGRRSWSCVKGADKPYHRGGAKAYHQDEDGAMCRQWHQAPDQVEVRFPAESVSPDLTHLEGDQGGQGRST